MSPASDMTSNTTKNLTVAVDGTLDTIYNSRYGRITILRRVEDFSLFKTSLRAALVSASAWQIVQGVEAAPAVVAGRPLTQQAIDYRERSARAIQLISNSIDPKYNSRLEPFLLTADPAGMWNEMLREDQALDNLYQNHLRSQFNKLEWNSSDEKLADCITRLEAVRAQLADTEQAIDDVTMKVKVLDLVPMTGEWQTTKLFALQNNYDLVRTIAQLEAFESAVIRPTTGTTGTTTAATAAIASTRGREGRRGRGRGRGRGGDRSRSSLTRPGGNKVEKKEEKCHFCGKKGHWQVDCYAYKRVQKEAQSKGKKAASDDDDSTVATTKVAHNKGTVLYSSCCCSNEPSSAIATVMGVGSTTSYHWVIDSGASQHFSSNYNDFNALKRWSTPRIVSLANNSTIQAIGTGDTTIEATSGTITLTGVWYTPDLNCRLVSTLQLNNKGVLVLLAESKVEAYYASKTQLLASGAQPLFTRSVRSNLYSIDQPTSANVYTITEPSITTINEDERELWHRRTAHLGFKYVEKLPDSVIGVSY